MVANVARTLEAHGVQGYRQNWGGLREPQADSNFLVINLLQNSSMVA
jgi:hypothetical protein